MSVMQRLWLFLTPMVVLFSCGCAYVGAGWNRAAFAGLALLGTLEWWREVLAHGAERYEAGRCAEAQNLIDLARKHDMVISETPEQDDEDCGCRYSGCFCKEPTP